MKFTHFFTITCVVLWLSACQQLVNEQELSRVPVCYTAYDALDVVLRNEENGEETALTANASGVYDFGTLEFGRYSVQVKAWKDGWSNPIIDLRRHFTVPVDQSNEILRLPSPGALISAVAEPSPSNYRSDITLALDLNCETADFSWYHISADSASVYTETDGVPFNGSSINLTRQSPEPFYLGIERWNDEQDLVFATKSEIIRVVPNVDSYSFFSIGERSVLDIPLGEVRNLVLDVPQDGLYHFDFYDNSNGSYTGRPIVVFLEDGFGEGRAEGPRGYGRLVNLSQGNRNLQVALAFPSTPGNVAVEVNPVTVDIEVPFNDNMVFSFDQNNQIQHASTNLEPGRYQFTMTPGAFNPQMPVYAWLMFSDGVDPEGIQGLGRIGPEYNEDQGPFSRTFSAANSTTLNLYLLSGYHGAPVDVDINLVKLP